ncbi:MULTISPECIES: hypothetical protein [Sphingobacterium]|uniref:hypothetical protein n=1 Tax=Sphingobacterium TaxID=28453 RepID=UPI001042B907|nr:MULTISPECIES: hypothetical protein [Sphingobacterium]MCW2263160.1 hypothetical protein [Sphingobacterium kitahiroshimense]TCR11856.1 hypothetical protein EDF67_103269 [Sphingobacterium sp. JUb78]
MNLYRLIILVFSVLLLSSHAQQNPIHKKWKLVAEEITYFNFDNTRYEESRDRLDSIKNETVLFLPNGSFKSSDGDGSYKIIKDSVHLFLNGSTVSLKYELKNSKLVMERHIKESRFIIRSKLYLE